MPTTHDCLGSGCPGEIAALKAIIGQLLVYGGERCPGNSDACNHRLMGARTRIRALIDEYDGSDPFGLDYDSNAAVEDFPAECVDAFVHTLRESL